ncbi:MAG: tight adherence pilus pseudopilin TadF, partial [Turicibacter sp.]
MNRYKENGTYIIELAITLCFLSSLLILFINHLLAFNKKGQLDRTAYSLVTLISERKQLFDGDLNLCSSDLLCENFARDLYRLAGASLSRVGNDFDEAKLGMRIDQISMTTTIS